MIMSLDDLTKACSVLNAMGLASLDWHVRNGYLWIMSTDFPMIQKLYHLINGALMPIMYSPVSGTNASIQIKFNS